MLVVFAADVALDAQLHDEERLVTDFGWRLDRHRTTTHLGSHHQLLRLSRFAQAFIQLPQALHITSNGTWPLASFGTSSW